MLRRKRSLAEKKREKRKGERGGKETAESERNGTFSCSMKRGVEKGRTLCLGRKEQEERG